MIQYYSYSFIVSYVPASDTKGSRVKIESRGFHPKIIPFNYEAGDIVKTATRYLESHGIEVAGESEIRNGEWVLLSHYNPLPVVAKALKPREWNASLLK